MFRGARHSALPVLLTRALGYYGRIRIPKKAERDTDGEGGIPSAQGRSDTIEAGSLDELAVRVQLKYPDELCERTLHRERDHEAEERRAHAMDQLIDILAQAVAVELLRDAQVT